MPNRKYSKDNKRIKFIRLCRNQRMGYQEIGNLLKISRQRVQQIDTGYRNPNSFKRPEDLKIWSKRKREFLGLSVKMNRTSGGLDFVRELVRQRDNNTCQKCFLVWEKTWRKFDVHHIDINQEGKRDIQYDRNNMDKMITYCHRCHLGLHSVRRKMSLGHKPLK